MQTPHTVYITRMHARTDLRAIEDTKRVGPRPTTHAARATPIPITSTVLMSCVSGPTCYNTRIRTFNCRLYAPRTNEFSTKHVEVARLASRRTA